MADWRGGKARASMSKQKTLDYVRGRMSWKPDCIDMWKITTTYFADWTFPDEFQDQWMSMKNHLRNSDPIGLLQLSILLEELQQEMDQGRKKRRTT